MQDTRPAYSPTSGCTVRIRGVPVLFRNPYQHQSEFYSESDSDMDMESECGSNRSRVSGISSGISKRKKA